MGKLCQFLCHHGEAVSSFTSLLSEIRGNVIRYIHVQVSAIHCNPTPSLPFLLVLTIRPDDNDGDDDDNFQYIFT